MISPKCESYFEAIEELILQTEEHELASVLVDVIKQYGRAEAASLYKLEVWVDDRLCPLDKHIDLSGSLLRDVFKPETEVRLTTEPGITEAIYTDRMVEIHDADNERILIPIHGLSGIEEILVISGRPDTLDKVFIKHLSRVYSRQYHLVCKSEIDALTGLRNRMSFNVKMGYLLNDLVRGNETSDYCLALVDIDRFKSINDRLGHLYGDEVLILMARLIKESFRFSDLKFRYGGEEFAIILDTDATAAAGVLERFRERVSSYTFPQIGQVTVSIGMTSIDSGVIWSTLVDRADRALYYVKQHGRNQMQVYEDLVEKGLLEDTKVLSDVEFF